jgi:hypothetical protein
LSDGVGLEECLITLQLETTIGIFDCCAIGDGDACTESIPESPPCSIFDELRRHVDADVDDCSINVVSICFAYQNIMVNKIISKLSKLLFSWRFIAYCVI